MRQYATVRHDGRLVCCSRARIRCARATFVVRELEPRRRSGTRRHSAFIDLKRRETLRRGIRQHDMLRILRSETTHCVVDRDGLSDERKLSAAIRASEVDEREVTRVDLFPGKGKQSVEREFFHRERRDGTAIKNCRV